MKIGIDARLWDQTGVGRYIKNLVINLQRIDNRNSYVLFVRKNDLSIVDKFITNKNWEIKVTDSSWHSFNEQYNFLKQLNKEDLDLVHFPYFSAPILYKKPYVVTIHDLIINHYPTGKASTLATPLYYSKLLGYNLVIKTISKKAKKIITPSIATKNEVIDHFKIDKDKIIVTYEAVDENFLGENDVKEKLIDKEYFLYVGNAYPHKNLEKLIDAFNIIKDEVGGSKLVLVGNTDYFYLNIKKKTEKLSLQDRVIFFGKANDSDLHNLYKNAICLVMPSLMEGFGLPVLEAMANKCLVACSNIDSLKEITKQNCLYFNPLEVNEISKNLTKAYSKDYDSKIKDKAFELSKEFSWEKTAKETLKVYESSISLR